MCRLLHSYFLYSISIVKVWNVLFMCFYCCLVLATVLLLFALKYAPKEYKLYLLPKKKGSSDMVPDYFLSSILCHSTLLFSPLVPCFWQHWPCFSSSKFHFFPIQKLCNCCSSGNALPLGLHGLLPPLFELHQCCSNHTMKPSTPSLSSSSLKTL